MIIIEESKALANWLHEKLDGIDIRNDERTRTAASCHDIALEHQQAVMILVEHRLYGSAFALARSSFEAYVRGVWILNCATDAQLKLFLQEKLSISFGKFVDDIENLAEYSAGVLSTTKQSTWGLLNSFTHTGFNQIVRRQTNDAIQADYTQDDIEDVVRFVNAFRGLSSNGAKYWVRASSLLDRLFILLKKKLIWTRVTRLPHAFQSR